MPFSKKNAFAKRSTIRLSDHVIERPLTIGFAQTLRYFENGIDNFPR